jgi:hypothetical protein
MRQSTRYVGIMVSESNQNPPFRDQRFYRRLCKTAYGCRVFCYVFSPHRIDWVGQKVVGYKWDAASGHWIRGVFPLPHIIYDRCFYKSSKNIQLCRENIKRLKKQQGILFLGQGLKGKWYVHQLLSKHKDINNYLPPTAVYQGGEMLKQWLKQYSNVFLKPQGGSQGKRTLHIKVHPDRIDVNARDGKNRSIRQSFTDLFSLADWVEGFIGSRKYLLQPYLELSDRSDRAFDVRAFVQKNGHGKWELVGMAVRQGQPGSMTSNLHGGGSAIEAAPFLSSIYGEEQAELLLQKMRKLAKIIPPVLEEDAGRQVELGIDFGIDRLGALWILEANSKPGRSIFAKLKNWKARFTSVQNPIRYASFIMDRQLGG